MKEEKKIKKNNNIKLKSKKALLKDNISKDKIQINDNKNHFNGNNSKNKILNITNFPTKKNSQFKKCIESEKNLKQINFVDFCERILGCENKNKNIYFIF